MVKKLLAIVISILFFSNLTNAQTCASTSIYPYEWPSHRNWFMAPGNVWDGQIVNMSTGAITVAGKGGAINYTSPSAGSAGVQAYEGTSAVSDDKGNLLFYTNGRLIFRGTGASTTIPYAGLLTGNENGSTSTKGSAMQGVMTVRHPLDTNNYYIFTTDDANGGTTLGFNYAKVSRTGTIVTSPTRLGSYRTTEGVSATKHANGVDIWITCMSSASGTNNFYTYLLTCTGLNTTPVVSAVAPPISSSGEERGCLAFSYDGTKFAQAHPNATGGNSDKEVSIYSFNKSTGVISNPLHVSSGAANENAADILFSPDGKRVFYTTASGQLFYYDISSGVASTILGTRTQVAGVSRGTYATIEIGPDGNLYMSPGAATASTIAKISGNLNTGLGASGFTVTNVTGTLCTFGLPTMYLPPAEEPDIQEVGPFCVNDAAVDLNTTFICSGVSAEDAVNFSTAYSGTGITNSGTGIFNPSTAGAGTHRIIFTRCNVDDTIWIVVKPLPTATLSGTTAICSGNSTNLSVALTGTQPWAISYSDGTTTTNITGITASPYVISVSPTSTKTYTLSTVSDVNCTGTVSGSAVITVNPRPTATISGGGAVCLGNSTNLSVALTGSQPWSISYSDGTTTTNITGITSSPYSISVSPTANKTYTLSAVSDANCTGSVFGSATVTINPKPTATISGSTVLCTGNSTNLSVALTGSPNWTITYTDGTTPVTISGITSSPYLISVSPTSTKTYTLTAVSDLNCTGTFSGTALVTVNAKPTATISGTSPLCNGASTNLSVVFTGLQPWSITYTDGTTPVTITGITTSPYNIPVSPTSNKTYSLTAVSDVNCAGTVSGSAVITVNNRPTATISGTTAICIGASTNISVALTGTPNWTITYTDGTTPVTVSGITTSPYVISVSPTSTKTYTVTAVNDANCTGTVSGSAVVTVNTKPTAVISGGATYCIGGTTNLSVALTGAQPWSVTYFDGTTSTTVTGITASPFVFAVSPTSTKTYTVTAVSDANCTGTFSGSATVTVNPKPTASISGNSTICNGQSANLNVVLTGTPNWNITYTDGTVSTTINGITASPYTIAVSPISTKTYTVTAVSDANCTGTSFTGSAIVTVNPKPTAVISGTTSICSGASTNLSVALTGTPNWTITYTDGTTPVTISGITSSPYLIPVTTTTNKTFTLTAVSDVNCVGTSFTGSAVVSIYPNPTATISGTTAICAGASTNLSVALTGNPNWTITYTDGTTPVTISGITSSPYIISVSPASTTSYTITAVADANCTGTFSGTAIVTINPKPTATLSGTNAICIGASSNLSVALTGTPNWTITYTDGTTPVTISGITSSPYLIPVSPTSTKTYSLLTVTDANCSGTFSGTATVTVNPKPTAIISGTTPICIGASTNLSVALTGNQPWTITYTDGTTPVTISGITASPYLISVSPTSTKTYTLTAVSDVNCVGTSFTGSATVTVNPKPTATITGTNAICIGASTNLSVALTGNQPWSITFTDGTTPVTISGITSSPYVIAVSPTSTTNYSLTAVSDVNCVGTFSGTATVTVNPKPTATISGTTPICIGGSTNLSVALTGTPNWTITYTDGTTPVTISGISASPYLISVSPTSTKTYSLTAVSDVNCVGTISGTATVTVNPKPTATISGTAPICLGASINLTVALTGNQPWSITYTDGTTPVTISGITSSPYSISVSPSATTTYSLTAVSDVNCVGTSFTGTATITVNPRPTATISGNNTICVGASTNLSIALTGTQPWSVTVFDGTTSNTINGITASPFVLAVSPTSTKTYTVSTVNDANCTGTFSGSALVTVNPLATATISGNATICNGQSSNLNVVLTGTPNWTITYNDGTVNTSITGITSSPYLIPVSPTSTKTYTLVSVSDANCTGGTVSGNATITVNPKPTATISGTTAICAGNSTNLSVALTGTPNWTITYTDGTTPVTISGITSSPYLISVSPTSTKTYTLTAVNDANCSGGTFSGSAVVTVNPNPTATISGTTAICEGSSTNLNVALTGNPNWTITYTDGTTPVTISGITTSPYLISVSPASSKTYAITAVSDANCTGTFSGSAVVTVNPKPTATISGTTAVCIGASTNLSVALTGSPNWTITYTDGTTPVTISGITTSPYLISVSPTSTKTYSITAVNDANCTGTFSGNAIVTVNPKPTVVANTTASSICIGGNVTLTGSGASTYTWDNGVTNNVAFAPTSTQTYTVTGTDANGCVNTATVTVTVNSLPTVVATGGAFCEGGAGVTISASGAVSYLWSPTTNLSASNIANPIANPATTTTYTVTGTDINGCKNTATATVTVNPKPNIVANASATSVCLGGSITLFGSGGVSYVWDNGVTDNVSFSPTTTKTYTVTGTDANGCTKSASVNVIVNSGLTAVATGGQYCLGDAGVTLTSSGAGLGGTYSWSPATNLSATNISNPLANPATTTTYVVTATDVNGCKDTASVTVVVNTKPTVAATGGAYCTGGAGVTLGASGANSYAWSPATNLSATNISNPLATPLNTTTYTVTGTDANGCTNTATATVTVNPKPIVTATGGAYCEAGAGVTLNAGGAVTYSWSPATDLSATNIANPLATPLTTTTYTVTGTDANGCTNTATATVTVNPKPVVVANASKSVICLGESTVLTGSGASTYTWDNGATNNVAIFPLTTTTYTVTGTDANGCINTATKTITVNALPTVNATGGEFCQAGAGVNLGASGAVSYVWSPVTNLSDATIANPLANPNTTTTYTVTGTDANGCKNTATATVTVNPKPNIVANSTDASVCTGSSITLSGSGGVSYNWDNGVVDNVSFVPTATTTYTVTGTDAKGCTNTASVTVKVNVVLAVNATGGAYCIGTSGVTLNTIGGGAGTTYSWSPTTNLSDPNIANPVANPPVNTTYTVTVTDINGCTNSATALVTVSNKPTVTATGGTYCFGDAGVTLGASGADTYVWSPATNLSATNISNPLANPATTTTYTVTGTDANGCTNTATATVNVNSLPTVTATGGEFCEAGAGVTLGASGADTYVWSPATNLSATNISNPLANPATTTTYTVTGTDANGCKNTATALVTVNPKPNVVANSSATSVCTGGSLTLTGSGATSYSWNNGVVDNVPFVPTSTATYTVTGTDLKGCTNTNSVTVTVNTDLVVTATGGAYCEGDAGVTLASTGAGVGGTYSWSPATNLSATNILNPLANPTTTTTYTVTATDVNGCKNTATATVTVNTKPTVTATGGAYCEGGTGVTLSASGATTYSWNPATNLSDATISNPLANPATTTTYTVTGTDGNGCKNTATATVTVNPKPTVTATGGEFCEGGTGTALQAGGAFTYSWSPNTNLSASNIANPIATPLTTTTYTVTGTDINGCQNTATATITVNPKPTVTANASATSVCIGENVTLNGGGAISYTWDNGVTNNVSFIPASTTTYSVTGTDAKGCFNTALVNVQVNPKPIVTATGGAYCIGSTGVTLGASGAVTYVWSPATDLSASNIANPIANPATTTTYTVTGTDANGCKNDATATVTVNTLPNVTANSSSAVICATQTVTLTGAGASSYTWDNGVFDNVAFTPTSTQTYTVTGTDGNGCKNTATTTVTVNDKPTSTLSGTTAVCNNISANMSVVLTGSQPWNLTYTDGTTDVTINNITTSPYLISVKPNTTTTYTIKALSDANCVGTAFNGSTVVTINNPSAETITRTACKSFVFNGITQTTSGLYKDTLVNKFGCDSILTLDLTINNPSAETITRTACVSYFFNGATITSSGLYNDTLVNKFGCDSILTLDLTINNPSTTTLTETACSSYLFNGVTETVSGVYVANLKNKFGCDSTVTLNLTINKPDVVLLNETACNSFVFNGNTYTSSGVYVANLKNKFNCDSTVTLNLNINKSDNINLTETACSSFLFNGTTYTSSGVYVANLKNKFTCDSTVTLNLTINNPSTTNLTEIACSSFDFNGTTYTSSGVYVANLKNKFNCDSTVTLNLTINNPSTTILTETACSSYVFNGNTYTTSGVYVANLKNKLNCDSTVTLNLTINNSNTTNLTETACSSYQFNGNTYTSSGVYVANLKNKFNCDSTVTLNLTINNPSTTTLTEVACASFDFNGTTYTSSGVYVANLKNKFNCDSTVTLNLTINNPSTTTLTETACTSYLFNGITYTNSGVYVANLKNKANCDSTVTLNLTINNPSTTTLNRTACSSFDFNGNTYTSSGVYVANLKNKFNCDSTVTLNLTINNPSTTTLTETACDSYLFNGTTYTNSGQYVANLKNKFNCDSTVTLNLTINKSSQTVLTETACKSFTFNGVTQTASGVYVANLKNKIGCDSTVTLNLTINNPSATVLNVTACDAYVFNGKTETSTGLYVANLKNKLGCDSTVTLNLIINKQNNVNVNVSACSSYLFNGTTYTTSGIYVANLKNKYTCDSTVTLNLTINNPSTTTLTETACSNFLFNGTNYTTSGVYVANLKNKFNCDSTVTLNLTINNPSTTTLTETACLKYVFNGITYNASGVYVANLKNKYGCDSTVTLNLTIRPLPTAQITGNSIICKGDSATISIVLTGSSPWSLKYEDGLTISTLSGISSSPYIFKVAPNSTRNYQLLTLSDANNCEALATSLVGRASITVNSLPFVSLQGNNTVCQGASSDLEFVFNQESAKPYTIKYASNGVVTQIAGITTNPYLLTVDPLTNTGYKIVQVNDRNCKGDYNSDSVLVEIAKYPNVVFNRPLDTICSNQEYALKFSSTVPGTAYGTSFDWTTKVVGPTITGYAKSGTGQPIIVKANNKSSQLSTIMYLVEPTYTYNNAVCVGKKDTAMVTIKPALNIEIGNDRIGVCPGTPLHFSATKFPNIKGYYEWYLDNELQGTNEDTINLIPENDATLTVKYIDGCGDNYGTTNITMLKKVKPELIVGDSCANFVITFEPKMDYSGISIWVWNYNLGAKQDTTWSKLSTSTYTFANAGLYDVHLQGVNGTCVLADTVFKVKVIDCDIHTVNTFTPNGDGQNDTWKILGLENYPNAKIEIFNRWGVKVRYMANGLLEWDGTNNHGELLEEGVYYYVIDLNRFKGHGIIKGYITLLRSINETK
ncbi:MAG: hypothetical protein RLZZ175_1941 [Bacteroidota bacterium]|jgi:gliding motility-associated-like protein